MDPPGIVVFMVTVCGLVYVPAGGLKVGAESGRLYVAVDTAESVQPDSYAMDFIVSLAHTLNGTVYGVPTVLVGVLPSVV